MGFWYRCIEEIIPILPYVRRKACKYRLAESEHILEEQQYARYATLSANSLLERLREERQRAYAMDEKTFKLTLSLSVGLAILGSTSAILVKQVSLSEARFVLVVLIILGLFYVFLSGSIALGALKTLPSYGYGTQLLLLDAEERQPQLAKCLAQAEAINIVRHLRNETAYQSLRNGLILLFLAAVVFVVFLGLETLAPGLWESGITSTTASS